MGEMIFNLTMAKWAHILDIFFFDAKYIFKIQILDISEIFWGHVRKRKK